MKSINTWSTTTTVISNNNNFQTVITFKANKKFVCWLAMHSMFDLELILQVLCQSLGDHYHDLDVNLLLGHVKKSKGGVTALLIKGFFG